LESIIYGWRINQKNNAIWIFQNDLRSLMFIKRPSLLMKNLSFLFLLFTSLTLTLTSCSKDDDGDGGTRFECQVDGDGYKTTGINAYAVNFSGDSYTVYGNMPGEETVIYINLDKSAGEGTFQMGDFAGNISAYVSEPNNVSFSTILAAGTGEVTVSSLSDTRVKGSFSFNAVNFDNPTDFRVVTEGEFDVEFN